MEVSPSSINAFLRSAATESSVIASSKPPPSRQNADRVELSAAAGSGSDAETIRTDLVRRVRAEIAAETYLTDSKVEAAVNRLHRELFGGG
jgi:hypothetical protein